MRGILDLDWVCLTEIFKNLTSLDLCSMRQCSKRLRHFVDDHLHSLYFVREQWLDLENENIRNVDKILKNFGQFVCYLKVRSKAEEPNLMLDVIANSCGDILRGLSLTDIYFYEFDMQKLAEVFDKLEVLKIIHCHGDQICYENFMLGHEYPNLTTLRIQWCSMILYNEVLTKFFMKKRSIKKLDCWIEGKVLPLIFLNAAEIEDLRISVYLEANVNPTNPYLTNVMPVAQLRNLKRLDIYDSIKTIALIKQISISNDLEMIGICGIALNEECCDAVSKLTNVKDLRLRCIRLNGSTSIQMLCRKLSKLESLTFVDCPHVPYRNVVASVCKLGTLRTIYIMARYEWYIASFRNFIEQMLKDFLDGNRSGHSCFVSGNPLYIYLSKDTFKLMKGLFTEDNLISIEKYGNIKILQTNKAVFGEHRCCIRKR